MRYSIFFLLSLFYFNAFTQYTLPTTPTLPQNNYNVNVTVKEQKTLSEVVDESTQRTMNAIAASQANAAALAQAEAARAAAMSKAESKIKTPLKVDLNDYSHIALVSVRWGNYNNTKRVFNDLESELSDSPLTIINPYKFDKKRAKKNRGFLREIKNPKWLYIYVSGQLVGVDTVTNVVLRNSNNETVWHITSTNILFSQIIEPIIFF